MYPTTAHYIFFGVFMAAALPVLYYYRRRNPDPRFRPGFGEMAMVTLFAVFVCGALAFGLGSVFQEENDGQAALKKPNGGAGWSRGLYNIEGPERVKRQENKEREKSGPSRVERSNEPWD